MTRDDIIRMAREAGVEFDDEAATGMYGFSIWERFAELVAAAEREECAMICDVERLSYKFGTQARQACCDCGEQIRAKGEA